MTKYAVELTDTASAAILSQARYIAVEAQAPESARHWLEQIWDAVESLERWPRRGGKAEEDNYVWYEVRRFVVGLRHGHRLPRPGDLPPDGAALEDDDPAT